MAEIAGNWCGDRLSAYPMPFVAHLLCTSASPSRDQGYQPAKVTAVCCIRHPKSMALFRSSPRIGQWRFTLCIPSASAVGAARERNHFFRHLYQDYAAQNAGMAGQCRHIGQKQKPGSEKQSWRGGKLPVRRPKAVPKLRTRGRQLSEINEIVRTRAEAEAAIADAQKSDARLREAIDILPQWKSCFLDAEGRYILWNKKYAGNLFQERGSVRAWREAARHAQGRRRPRRLSRGPRPRRRMDQRAPGQDVSSGPRP